MSTTTVELVDYVKLLAPHVKDQSTSMGETSIDVYLYSSITDFIEYMLIWQCALFTKEAEGSVKSLTMCI